MKAVDTNILVRFLVNDDVHQAKKVYTLFLKAEKTKESFFVSDLVLCELIWVLESVYRIKRNALLSSIKQLTLMPLFHFENTSTIHQFLDDAIETKFDLTDLLIAHLAKSHGCQTVFTFDKKAAKHTLFELVG